MFFTTLLECCYRKSRLATAIAAAIAKNILVSSENFSLIIPSV